jgi:membrane fusion protein, epimerase transport system
MSAVIDHANPQLPSQIARPMPVDDRPYRRLGLLVLLLAFGLFGGWAALAPLDSAVVSPGLVKVEARRKVIQHLEGGIVSEILVRDGQLVDAGEILVKLSDIEPKAQLRIVRLQLLAGLALGARLKAERDGADEILFPDPLLDAADDPEVAEMMDGEIRVFEVRRESRANESRILNQRIEQLRKQIVGLEGRLRSQMTRIESYTSEVDEWERLFKAQLADKLRLIQLKREQALLEGEHASDESRLAELHLAIGETESQILLREQTHLSEITSTMRETQAKNADLATRMLALEDKLQRTLIRTPVRGVVVGLQVRTEGAVISPGQPLMEIVPSSEDYVVVGRIDPAQVDSLRVGQSADIRFSAFDVQNTYVVEGELVNLSADVLQDPATGVGYYEAEIRVTENGYEQMRADGLDLLPGMPAETMIKTGGRTLLNYLLKPYLDMFARAFKEE